MKLRRALRLLVWTVLAVVLVFALVVGLATALIATLVGVWRSGRIDLPLELSGALTRPGIELRYSMY